MSRGRTRYNPFALHDRYSADPTSPITVVRSYLGKRLRVLLSDGTRQILGIFVALDHTGTLTFREGVEIVDTHERTLGTVHIPLIHVQSMETAE
jgi:small nuclear ribonucleoprotein (snRNP)-like protein